MAELDKTTENVGDEVVEAAVEKAPVEKKDAVVRKRYLARGQILAAAREPHG